MKTIKTFLGMVVCGAGAAVGTFLVKEGIETAKDPYKRAVIKKKAIHIKDTILKKD